MEKYRRLNKIARNMAENRGHKLGKFRLYKRSVRNMAPLTYVVSIALCQLCGEDVRTTTAPLEDESEIFGLMFKKDCTFQAP